VVALPFDGGAAKHVRVGEHVGGSVPSPANHAGSSRGQGDHGVCRSQQHVLLRCMCVGSGMMRVPQVVHRIDKRLVKHLQFLHHLRQHLGTDGVETEMDVEHVEPLVIVANPAGFEHQRRPPAARHGPTISKHRIIKAHNGIEPAWWGQVSNVDVRSRHRGDAQQDAPHRSVIRLARGRYTIGVRVQGPCLHPRAAVPAVLEDAADG
jgi:hypothetical protein